MFFLQKNPLKKVLQLNDYENKLAFLLHLFHQIYAAHQLAKPVSKSKDCANIDNHYKYNC